MNFIVCLSVPPSLILLIVDGMAANHIEAAKLVEYGLVDESAFYKLKIKPLST